jgi:3-(3-hydroxy-phenyl)propionate hydroxylase
MAYTLPTFPWHRAPEQDGATPRHPVAIVGGGLTGLTAACDLATRGIPVVLLDEDDTVGVRGASSRGICYAQRSLEIFERLGIYDRIAAKGARWSVGRVLVDHEEIYAFDLAQGSASRQPPFINIQQFYVEWYLADRLAELPAADLRWRHKVTGARPAHDHVKLDVETPEGRYVLEASWVIDASGLGSAVRTSLGVETRPQQGVDRWCISDVRFHDPVPPERWTWVQAPFNEGRAVWQHQMADGVWRIDYQMDPDITPEQAGSDEVATARLRAHLGETTEIELVWVGPWGYRTHLLDDFRHGRVFFAGDAAHVFSPFGARGGNSGIQDAENLAWKLAFVIQGIAPETLLDSYSAERRPAAAFNIMTTERSARFIAPRSPFERALRDATLGLARRYEFARRVVNMGRMSAPFVYADSPLTTNGGDAAPNVGFRFADGREGSLADLLRHGSFAVLLGTATKTPPGLPIWTIGTDLHGETIAALVPPGTALVIRPDQHIAARLDAADLDSLHAAIARATGHAAKQRLAA